MQLSQSINISYCRINGTLVLNSTDMFNRMDLSEFVRITFNGTPISFPNTNELLKLQEILQNMRNKYNNDIIQESYIIEFKDIGLKIDLYPCKEYSKPGFNIFTEWLRINFRKDGNIK